MAYSNDTTVVVAACLLHALLLPSPATAALRQKESVPISTPVRSDAQLPSNKFTQRKAMDVEDVML